MPASVDAELDRLVTQYIDINTANNSTLLTEYDHDWPSPCLLQEAVDGQMVPWQPVLQAPPLSMHNLSQGLEMQIDPQFAAFFSRYYSHDLPAIADRGELLLLQIWNEEDAERLQKNIIAHVLMKRRLKQRETLFFALTDQDDFIISVENSSGNVVLEQVGKEPQEVLANNIAEFLATLQAKQGVASL